MIAFAFSLQGQEPRYFNGLYKNAEAIKRLWPDATMLIYTTENIPDLGIKTRVFREAPCKDTTCHFWRFKAITLKEYDHVCVRDIDSTIGERETLAVKLWIESGKTYHCMRDHPCHSYSGGCPHPILGGMWGAVPARSPDNFLRLVNYWIVTKRPFVRFSDMWFLQRYIYPYLLQDGIQFDSQDCHWGGVPFPGERTEQNYVGKYDY